MTTERIDPLAVMDREAIALMDRGFTRAANEVCSARKAVAELVEANRRLTRAVRDFADGEMSGEIRNRLFTTRYEEPAKETFFALCRANDEAEAALAAFGRQG